MNLRHAILWGALTLSLACDARYDSARLERLAGTDAATLTRDGLAVPEGGVLAFRLQPHAIAGRRSYDVDDEVALRSSNNRVARLEPGSQVETWFVLGHAVGDTEIEVRVNGSLEERIPVSVLPERAPGGQ